jgi:hypothetical protein
MEALWALGALEPKYGVWWKGCRKQLPKVPFSGTETFVAKIAIPLMGLSLTS